ncbi:SGNH/GDSL hydrolase family protein [Homoserinibacter sp. YIM 151385]|uniref:SGNH/GDSL hydrolase family protein n=1 Tax=Homoserinibacter sp. YIM 151385 TaxID=2985506 RepID=UPI0022F032E0|nr:SGNH/GDSL hydrolase family protein [Homoserinibacter sp. YIM 151385]WBU37147.1 SGNH/GDSL hydrolase family protein [Homoserinibacter sp. YIM 151385]
MRPILFIGDSITDAGRRGDPEGLGAGWVRIAAAALRERGDDRPVVNRGISGDRVVDLRRRWVPDVIDHEPELLTVYVGINDTWRRYDSDDPTSAGDFEADYRGILEQLQGDPALILVEPFVLPVTAEQERWHEDLDAKRAVVRALAVDFGAELVPLQSVLSAETARAGAEALAGDGVHPTPLGSRLIAEAWLAAYDAEARDGAASGSS